MTKFKKIAVLAACVTAGALAYSIIERTAVEGFGQTPEAGFRQQGDEIASRTASGE